MGGRWGEMMDDTNNIDHWIREENIKRSLQLVFRLCVKSECNLFGRFSGGYGWVGNLIERVLKIFKLVDYIVV
jgi:hypothetical protein